MSELENEGEIINIIPYISSQSLYCSEFKKHWSDTLTLRVIFDFLLLQQVSFKSEDITLKFPRRQILLCTTCHSSLIHG